MCIAGGDQDTGGHRGEEEAAAPAGGQLLPRPHLQRRHHPGHVQLLRRRAGQPAADAGALQWHHPLACGAVLATGTEGPLRPMQTGFSDFQRSMSTAQNGAVEGPGDSDKRQALYGAQVPITCHCARMHALLACPMPVYCSCMHDVFGMET